VKNKYRFLLLALMAFETALPVRAFGATEWQFEQKHHATGWHKFYITPKEVKLVNVSLGYQLVSRAPKWDVSAFRTDDKVSCNLSLSEYFKEQTSHPENLRINKFPVVKVEDYQGVKTTVYRGPHHDDWVATFKGVPNTVYDLISAYYKAPPVDGVVLRSFKPPTGRPAKRKLVQMWVDEHESGTRIATFKMKEAPYNSGDFVVPKGLKPVKDFKTVTTSIANRREAESIIEQMGLGEALGKTGGKK